MVSHSTQKTLTSSIIISQYLADDILGNHTHQQIKVHSVFPNGFNLDLNGQLIFVGKHNSDISAFGMTIEAQAFKELQASLVVGQRVRITPSAWTFYTRPTLIQLLATNFEKLVVDIVPISLEALQASPLERYIEEANVLAQSGFAHSVELNQLLLQWEQAVQTTRELVQPALIRQLIGAGIGLTPSGDDFLQGMLLLEQALGKGDRLAQCVQTVLAERSTTAVSLAYYQALFAGKVNASWVKLLTAIKEGHSANLKAAIHQIQTYGATSGNDILLGIGKVLKYI